MPRRRFDFGIEFIQATLRTVLLFSRSNCSAKAPGFAKWTNRNYQCKINDVATLRFRKMNVHPPSSSAELDELIAKPDEPTVESLRDREGDYAVLGAGGKMGYHFCLMLQQALTGLGRKEPVHAVSRFRSVRARGEFESIGCKVIPADLSEPEQLEQLPSFENIFYLAGVKFGTSQDSGLLERMNVTMPRMVAERFQQSDIVAMSTGCVYSFASPDSGGSTEEDETDPPGEYAKSCLGRESAFFGAADRFGARSALIRLNYSIDLRYGVLVDLAQKVIDEKPVDVSMGYVNLIWQGDAVRHSIRAMQHVSAPPFILNVTGPEILQVRDLALKLGQRLGKSVTFSGTESPTAWLNNANKAHDLFGRPEMELDQMIDMVAEWIQNGGELLGKPTHFETRDGKY